MATATATARFTVRQRRLLTQRIQELGATEHA
jgi:hypothetical protein